MNFTLRSTYSFKTKLSNSRAAGSSPVSGAVFFSSRKVPLAAAGSIASSAPPSSLAFATSSSRSWPDAWDAGRGDECARARYEEHLAHFLAREDLWAGDFDSSSHWLPQYLWIGLWLADGSP